MVLFSVTMSFEFLTLITIFGTSIIVESTMVYYIFQIHASGNWIKVMLNYEIIQTKF